MLASIQPEVQHGNEPSPTLPIEDGCRDQGFQIVPKALNLFSFTSAAVSSLGSCPIQCDFKHLSAKSELQI